MKQFAFSLGIFRKSLVFHMDLFEKINKQVYVIAEMSGNHAGSKDRAMEIVHAAKESGADCIKIQTYTPDTITLDCNNEYFHIDGGTWDGENLYHLYEKAFTPWEWQADIKAEAEKVGIDFLSTAFDSTSVDFLESIGLDFYKIASFELTDIPLLKYVASTGKPIIMSTGMSTFEEIEASVKAIKDAGNEQLVLLKCSSDYPAITGDMNLNTMVDMGKRLSLPVGLSDHSMGSVGVTAAVAMGARVIEKHFCLSRAIENPDSTFSMEPAEFKKMVEDIRAAELAMGSVKYGPSQRELANLKFRQSIFCSKDIKAGEVFTKENIRVVRPAYGLPPVYFEDVLGKKATSDIAFGTPLTLEMVEGLK